MLDPLAATAPRFNDEDLLTATRAVVMNCFNSNSAAFARYAKVGGSTVARLVNQGTLPVGNRVRTQIYEAAVAVLQRKVRVNPSKFQLGRSYLGERPQPAKPERPADLPKNWPFSPERTSTLRLLAASFRQERLILAPDCRVTPAYLRQVFSEWMAETSDAPITFTPQQFGWFVKLIYPEVTIIRRNGSDVYHGIAVRPAISTSDYDEYVPPAIDEEPDDSTVANWTRALDGTTVTLAADGLDWNEVEETLAAPSHLEVLETSKSSIECLDWKKPELLARLKAIEEMALNLAIMCETLCTGIEKETI